MSAARALCCRVHDRDIYEECPHASYRSDMQGWNSKSHICGKLMREVRPHRVVPFPNTTDAGAEFFRSIGFGDVDLLSIDAAHTYEAVYADICNWWPLVGNGGTVFGDDFIPHYPGVERAVRRFCQEHSLPFETDREKWIIRKP